MQALYFSGWKGIFFRITLQVDNNIFHSRRVEQCCFLEKCVLPSSSTCKWPLCTRFMSITCGIFSKADGLRKFKLLLAANDLHSSSRICCDGWHVSFLVWVTDCCSCVWFMLGWGLFRHGRLSVFLLKLATSMIDDSSSLDSADENRP